MPTFFVNIINLYLNGFDNLDKLSIEEQKTFYEIRKSIVEDYLNKQFMLSYYTNMTKADIDNLVPFELDYLYNLLIKQKESESSKD